MKTKNKIFLAKLIYFFLSIFFKKKNIHVKRNKLKWNLDLNEAIDLHIFIFGNFEPEIKNTAKKLGLHKHGVILDIGANFGVQSLQFAKEFTSSKIYSIEPTDYAFSKLKENIELNQNLSQNIKPYQFFLGDLSQNLPESIYSSWNFEKEKNKHQKHLGTKKKTNNASVITLSRFIEIHRIKEIDFIKLDVDGYEYSVIKSGFDYLKTNRTPIFMELAPYLYKEYGYSSDEFLKLISSLKYKFYELKNFTEIKDIKREIINIPDGSSQNVLLI